MRRGLSGGGGWRVIIENDLCMIRKDCSKISLKGAYESLMNYKRITDIWRQKTA